MNIKVLKGGYNAWKEAGYPMETGLPTINNLNNTVCL